MASARGALLLAGALSFLVAPGVSSQAFLGRDGQEGPLVSVGELRATLERAFQESLGRHAGASTLEATERALAPVYAALPKNPNGHIAHATVRYSLHRYFAQRHGWLIRGLSPDGAGWNSSLPTTVTQDRVPAVVQGLIEQRSEGQGLSLRELAVLAAVLEGIVHQDTMGWLEAAYRVTGTPLVGRATVEQVTEATDTFMMMFVLGLDLPTMNRTEVLAERSSVEQNYPGWGETKLWLDDVRQSFAYTQRARQNPFVDGALTFEAVAQLMEEVRDSYGRWQNGECTAMKHKMLALEDTRGSGRVSLAKFFGSSAEENGMFSESVAYLRLLGALDETDPQRLRVIIPNYILGPNNCVGASSLHNVCCINECEALMFEVEQQIAAPVASPEELVKVASALHSASVDAPRNLTASLRARLEEVANLHGGKVPLHGRLFGQWMHMAFPNECPYPHVSGSTTPRTPEEWMAAESDLQLEATAEEMAQYTGVRLPLDHEAQEEPFQWSGEEELLAVHHPERAAMASSVGSLGRCLVCLLLLGSFTVAMLGGARSLRGGKVEPMKVGGQKFAV